VKCEDCGRGSVGIENSADVKCEDCGRGSVGIENSADVKCEDYGGRGVGIEQEIDESWFCENCDKPHGEGKPLEVQEINYRKCVKCGKDSGIFEFCIDCRPTD
jgi:hypothetical protein